MKIFSKIYVKIMAKNLPIFKKKKKRTLHAKKQAGAELKKKEKDFLGPKPGKNLEIRSRN